MENRKGNGIFLGIVSLSTLIVAIIGATFAYFSASTQSEENAVNLEAYQFQLSLTMEEITANNGGMIPIKPAETISGAPEANNTNIKYAINVATPKCVDSNGLKVCAIYKVTIDNNAENEVTLNGILRTVANNAGPGNGTGTGPEPSGFTDLKYQSLEGNPETGFTLGSITSDIHLTADAEGSGIEIAPITIPGKSTQDTYVLIYINDTGSDQSGMMGANYQGQLIYTSQGGSGIALSIVKKIIEDHGGYIWATSKEGVGTCMHFVIRRYREKGEERI